MADPTIDALKNATSGLLYMSESDEPFEVVNFGAASGPFSDAELQKLIHATGDGVRQLTLPEFFDDLTAEEDWFGQKEKEIANQYKRLRDIIETQLKGSAVFRVDGPTIFYYVVGTTAAGNWVGVKAKATET